MHNAFTFFLVFALIVGIASFVYQEIIRRVALLEMGYEFDRTHDLIKAKAAAQGVSDDQPDVAFVLGCCVVARALAEHFTIWTVILTTIIRLRNRTRNVELLSEKAPCFLSGSSHEITTNLLRCGLINSPVVWCVWKLLRLLHAGWKTMRNLVASGNETAEYVISVKRQSFEYAEHYGGSPCLH